MKTLVKFLCGIIVFMVMVAWIGDLFTIAGLLNPFANIAVSIHGIEAIRGSKEIVYSWSNLLTMILWGPLMVFVVKNISKLFRKG